MARNKKAMKRKNVNRLDQYYKEREFKRFSLRTYGEYKYIIIR